MTRPARRRLPRRRCPAARWRRCRRGAASGPAGSAASCSASAPSSCCWCSGCTSATAPSRTRSPRPTPGSTQDREGADPGRQHPDQPAGDAGARLRQPRRQQHRPRRLDRPDAHRPRQAPDPHAVDPARPLRHRSPATAAPRSTPPTPTAGPPLLIRTINALTGLPGEPHRAGQLRRLQGADRLAGRRHALQPAQDRVVPAVRRVTTGCFQKGTITLDGRRALAYSRIRHTTNPQDTDITRTERQQRVMQSLSHQLVSFSSLLHLPVDRQLDWPSR